jgi:hypothetical protein
MATAPPKELPNNIFRIECGVTMRFSFKANASVFITYGRVRGELGVGFDIVEGRLRVEM